MSKQRKNKPLLTLEQRFAVIDLLVSGCGMTEAISILADRHPDWTVEKVKKLYFPWSGIYRISDLVGATKEQGEARKKHIIEVRAELARKGGETFKRLHEDPNFRSAHSKRCSERMSKTKTDVAYEEKRIKACKKKFADPVFREKNSQERREQMFLQRQDPGFLVANRIGLEKCWASTSEYRVENARRHFQRLWQDPDFRERKRQEMLLRWQDPEYKARMLESSRQRLVALWQDPDYRDRMSWLSQNRSGQNKNTRELEVCRMLRLQGVHVSDPIKSRAGVRYRKVQSVWTPASITMARERRLLLVQALRELTPAEIAIVGLTYWPDVLDLLPVEPEILESLTAKGGETGYSSLLQTAMVKLLDHDELRDLL